MYWAKDGRWSVDAAIGTIVVGGGGGTSYPNAGLSQRGSIFEETVGPHNFRYCHRPSWCCCWAWWCRSSSTVRHKQRLMLLAPRELIACWLFRAPTAGTPRSASSR